MTPTAAHALVASTLQRMSQLYGDTVFDEWAVIRTGPPATVEHYAGPRAAEFRRDFVRDIAPLERETTGRSYAVGDFDFTHAGAGTNFDAVLRLGADTYLLCNHTGLSMAEIRANPRWLKAQVPFVELSQRIQTDPVVES